MPNYMAIDSCSAIYLSKLLSNADDTAHILTELDNGSFTNKHYANTPPKERPQLLQDKYLGTTNTTRDGKKIFANLMSIHYLSTLIRNNEVQLVVTPIVLNELNPTKNIALVPFLRKYCKVVVINGEEAVAKHCRDVDTLANLYAKHGAMGTFFCAKDNARIPENDAYIMAEATLLGLNLITANRWDFKDKREMQDGGRLNDIFYVNEVYNHTFKDQFNNIMTPRPMNEHDLRLLHISNRLRFAQDSPLCKNPHTFSLITYQSNVVEHTT